MTEFFSNHWLGEENEKILEELGLKYDAYFDRMEQANKHPLCFDDWVKAGKPD